MRIDRKFVTREVNRNSKYKNMSANSFEQEFYNNSNRTKGFITKAKKRRRKKETENKHNKNMEDVILG